MSTFAYTAIARDGRTTKGSLSAESRAAAIAQVVQQGLHPVSVDEQRAGAAKSVFARFAGSNGHSNGAAGAVAADDAPRRAAKVTQKAVEQFTRELANLLAGGVSLARALSLLQREASGAASKALLTIIHDDVVGGTALADALAKHPATFSTVYVAMVRAGEQGGFLDVVLGQIADFRTREADLKGKVKAAMVYPCILAILAVGVLAFLLSWFIPRFSGIFAEFGGNLPTLTRIIVALSDIVTSYGLILVALLVAAFIFLRVQLRTNTGRRAVERFLLNVPYLGKVIAYFALVRFCRMLGTLVGSGVPLVASLRTAREAIGNQTLADTVTNAIDEVQRGAALSKSLAESPQLFPASVIETIAVAEETARLDKELVRIAGSYEADLDRQLRMLVAVAEPLLLFIMAAVIGTVVVGMLLPVFNLQDLIK